MHHQIPLGRILDVVEYEPPSISSPSLNLRGSRSHSVAGGVSGGASATASGTGASLQQSGGPASASMTNSHTVDAAGMHDLKKGYEHCFKIITAKRTYILCATVSTFSSSSL